MLSLRTGWIVDAVDKLPAADEPSIARGARGDSVLLDASDPAPAPAPAPLGRARPAGCVDVKLRKET